MEESAVAYAALLESLVKRVFTHIYKTCKWQSNCPNVKVGELVLLRDDTVRQRFWPLGRIENIYPGGDGIVRVVDVRTKTDVYRRPVAKIYPLEEKTFNEAPQGGGNVTESTSDSRSCRNCYKLYGHLLVIHSKPIVMNTVITI